VKRILQKKLMKLKRTKNKTKTRKKIHKLKVPLMKKTSKLMVKRELKLKRRFPQKQNSRIRNLKSLPKQSLTTV
jgi:hypothetical protein